MAIIVLTLKLNCVLLFNSTVAEGVVMIYWRRMICIEGVKQCYHKKIGPLGTRSFQCGENDSMDCEKRSEEVCFFCDGLNVLQDSQVLC